MKNSKHNALTKINISRKKRQIFLDVLAQTGQVAHAARAIGYTSPQYLNKLRREDEEFAEEWELALESAGNFLEEEAIRRGRDGVVRDVYYQGFVVGQEVLYSDQLLMFILKKINPEYRDSHGQVGTNVNVGIAVLPMTAKDENSWEKRAIDMHKGQQAIELEAKPVENLLTIRRGD